MKKSWTSFVVRSFPCVAGIAVALMSAAWQTARAVEQLTTTIATNRTAIEANRDAITELRESTNAQMAKFRSFIVIDHFDGYPGRPEAVEVR